MFRQKKQRIWQTNGQESTVLMSRLLFSAAFFFLTAGSLLAQSAATDSATALTLEKAGPGVLPSEVFSAAAPQLAQLQNTLPPGYSIVIGGEQAKQQQGFKNLAVVMGISIGLIFLALAFRFRQAIKPLLLLAAAPYGVVGALIALYVMRSPFGCMAFLGIASLIGVIVCHVIVLFDFIEEMHEKGEPLEQALLDAGIVRLRPVMITVGATILALFPLALHGGPLWQPLLCAKLAGWASPHLLRCCWCQCFIRFLSLI
jgi:multidrug efflux pump subunit AcrB